MTEGFLAKLAATLQNEARMHRLWYDLRSQAMFEAAFREDVLEIDKSLEAMIWRIASRYAELGGKRAGVVARRALCAVRRSIPSALLKHLAGDKTAIPELLDEVRRLLPTVC